jgi:hypothetical protein
MNLVVSSELYAEEETLEIHALSDRHSGPAAYLAFSSRIDGQTQDLYV